MSGFGIVLSGFTANWKIPRMPPAHDYLGITLRGILGRALFAAVCPYPVARCAECSLAAHCQYVQVFKPLDDTRLPAYIVHDWSISDRRLSVTVLLLGNAAQTAEPWIRGMQHSLSALDWYAKRGVHLQQVTDWVTGNSLFKHGRFHNHAQLHFLKQWPHCQSAAKVRFITPLLSKHQDQDPLLPALRTRVQRLRQQFGDQGRFDPQQVYWQSEMLATHSISISCNSKHRTIQGHYYQLQLTQFTDIGAALLSAGLWLHAGGQTALGLGRYQLEKT